MKFVSSLFLMSFAVIASAEPQAVHRRHFGLLKFNDLGRAITFNALSGLYSGADSPEKELGTHCVQGDSFEDEVVLANGIVESGQVANVSSERVGNFIPGIASVRRLKINFKKLQSWGKNYRLANVTHNCVQGGITSMNFAVGSELDLFGRVQGNEVSLANFESELAERTNDLRYYDIDRLPSIVAEVAFRHNILTSEDTATFKVPGFSWKSASLASCVFRNELVNTVECDDHFDKLVDEMDEGSSHANGELNNPEAWINVAL